MHMLSDPGMNCTLNRPLLAGTSAARITGSGAVAPQIKDYESWHAVWLGLAKGAEAEKRWIDAALSVEALPTLSALFIEGHACVGSDTLQVICRCRCCSSTGGFKRAFAPISAQEFDAR